MERNTRKWRYGAEIAPDLEKQMMALKISTNMSYNQMIDEALRLYFDKNNKHELPKLR